MENDPVNFIAWITILMKAQEGLRFHWQFYTTAYLIMVGWVMSRKQGLTKGHKVIIIMVFLLIVGGFGFNLRDYVLFLNAGYRHLEDKLPAYFKVDEDASIKRDESRDMGSEFHLMFSYDRYELSGYGALALSAALFICLVIWFLPTVPSETNSTIVWNGTRSGFKRAFCGVRRLLDFAKYFLRKKKLGNSWSH